MPDNPKANCDLDNAVYVYAEKNDIPYPTPGENTLCWWIDKELSGPILFQTSILVGALGVCTIRELKESENREMLFPAISDPDGVVYALKWIESAGYGWCWDTDEGFSISFPNYKPERFADKYLGSDKNIYGGLIHAIVDIIDFKGDV